MRYTRTHTYFWNEEDLAPLRKEAARLMDDWAKRAPYVDEETRVRGDVRCSALLTAITLCAEPAD